MDYSGLESFEMQEQQLLERITLDKNVMVGKPIIRGTRLTVEYILNLLASGVPINEILEEYEGLAAEDVYACLLLGSPPKLPTTSPGD